MIKQIFSASPDKLNPLFQQHLMNGRVHARDYAFYIRKLAFMQQQKDTAEKKDQNRNDQNG